MEGCVGLVGWPI